MTALQANQTPYAAPPIDVEYQTLPGEAADNAYSQAQSPGTARQEYTRTEQPSASHQSTQLSDRQRMSSPDQGFTQPAGAVRQRRRVTITPSQRRNMRDGRIVRQSSPGQVGVNLGPENATVTEPNSNIVRVLLGVFPFLRHWGGFL